jgi:hypothetical protein
MFDDTNARRATLVAGLILLIVLAAVAVMSAEVEVDTERTGRIRVARLTFGERIGTATAGLITTAATATTGERLMASLVPIEDSISSFFPDDTLAAYDIGIVPEVAIDVLEDLLESALPDLHMWLEETLDEFRATSGIDPDADFLSHLDHGLAVGMLAPETDLDGWPFPRKVVIVRVRDQLAVTRFLETWIFWQAGAIAPKTHGVLGASVKSEVVAGSEIVGLQLNGFLPDGLPLPSPSYALVGDYLIVSSVRSGVAETLTRLEGGVPLASQLTSDDPVVEVVRLNFSVWPRAWLRAEPFVGSLVDRLGGNAPAIIGFCRTMIQYLGEFGPAHGVTTLTPDGRLVFHFEMEPPVSHSAID